MNLKQLSGLIVVLFLLSGNLSWSQRNQLKAYIDYKSYYSPEHGSYLELHFQYAAMSVKFESVENGLAAKIGVKNIITKQETGDTVKTDSYLLNSPVMRDSVIEDFFDVIKYPLEPGKYVVSIELFDILSESKPVSGQLAVEVRSVKSHVGFSDIMIAEVATPTEVVSSLYKSGYEIIPRISNFYGQEMSFMPYYVELYNTNLIADSVFGLKQSVINTTTNTAVDGFSRFTKLTTSEVIPVFRKLDLTKLPSGSYALRLEMVDRNNVPVSGTQNYFFDRVNSIEDVQDITKIVLDPAFQQSITDDSLRYYLASLIPIARPAEARSILATLKSKNSDFYRKHIQQFWVQTSGPDAYNAWLSYKRTVLLVQTLFGTKMLAGYETDRGRVYLQYGVPNNVVTKESSPSEYPYEIWTYNKIKNFSNKRFIFYNPDLVTENYRLLHSDMVGEVQNYKWQMMLVKRNTSDTNTEDTQGTDHYGGNSNYNYRQY